MPTSTTHTVKVNCQVPDTFGTATVRGMFDIAEAKSCEETFHAEIPDDDDWKIGVIVGPSGSGKSTIARNLYGPDFVERFEWDPDLSVIDQVGDLVKKATHVLASVGFSSPPSWIKPYHVLSGGERFRCDLARALVLPGARVVFDEFTSVVDRTVAKIGSAAIAKAIRKGVVAKQFVAVTCHYDVIDWLEPDWVCDMASGKLARGSLWRRPEIKIEVRRATSEIWHRFRRHHYLSAELASKAKVFVGLLDGEPVGMIAVIHYPHPSGLYYREHRTVVLPDYQGIGIGNRMSELVASAYAATGKRYFASTLHPSHVLHRVKSSLWSLDRKNAFKKRSRTTKRVGTGKTSAAKRSIYSFRYIGPKNAELAKDFGIIY
jgi:energy-coupling factor transporter ATP-binding protein EcfA2